MLALQFDPITTEMVVVKKTASVKVSNSVVISAVVVSNFLELQFNDLIVKDEIEVTDAGAFSIYDDGSVVGGVWGDNDVGRLSGLTDDFD